MNPVSGNQKMPGNLPIGKNVPTQKAFPKEKGKLPEGGQNRPIAKASKAMSGEVREAIEKMIGHSSVRMLRLQEEGAKRRRKEMRS